MYIILLIMFLFFCLISYFIFNSKTKSEYYTNVLHQIIRQCIRKYGPFAKSNVPWITTIRVSDDGDIKLRLRDKNGIIDNNTIIKSLVHKMAHLYSDSSHDKLFNSIELQLLDSAKMLGYYKDSDVTIECN